MDLTKPSKLKALVLLFALTLGLALAIPQFAFAAEEPPATIDYTIKDGYAKGTKVTANFAGWINKDAVNEEEMNFNATVMNGVLEKMADKVICKTNLHYGVPFLEYYEVVSSIPAGDDRANYFPVYSVKGVEFGATIQLKDGAKDIQYTWWDDYFPEGFTVTKELLDKVQADLEEIKINDGSKIAGRYKSKEALTQLFGPNTKGENPPLVMLPYTVKGNENYNLWFKADYQLGTPAASPAAQDKWVKGKKGWWYRYADGTYAKGHTQIGGKYYFFDNDGWMKTGWQQATGNSDWYYFGGANDGVMKTSKWIQSGKKWYYVDAEGKMLTGKQPVGGKTYYFADNGAMTTGWKQLGADWYYFGGANDGVMKTSKWIKSGSKWYYLDAEGKMATGTKLLDNKRYYFTDSGAMVTGWKQIEGLWYYFGKANDGVMKTNKWIGNYWVNADGYMATDCWVDGDKYYVDANGKWVNGKKK